MCKSVRGEKFQPAEPYLWGGGGWRGGTDRRRWIPAPWTPCHDLLGDIPATLIGVSDTDLGGQWHKKTDLTKAPKCQSNPYFMHIWEHESVLHQQLSIQLQTDAQNNKFLNQELNLSRASWNKHHTPNKIKFSVLSQAKWKTPHLAVNAVSLHRANLNSALITDH